MEQTIDTSLLVIRLRQSLSSIEAMLREEQKNTELQQAPYLEALRNKTANGQDGNVTTGFFGTGALATG